MTVDKHDDKLVSQPEDLPVSPRLHTAQDVASDGWFRVLAASVSDFLWTTDMQLNITYVSPSIYKLTGYTAEEYIRMPVEKRLPPQSIETQFRVYQEELLMEQDTSFPKSRSRIVEVEYYRSDGSLFWASVHVAFLRDEHGNAVGIQGITRDISDKKAMEQALQENIQLMHDITENMFEIVVVTDINNVNIFVSASTGQLGYTQEEVVGLNVLEKVHPDDREMMVGEIEAMKSSGKPRHYECRVISSTGQYIWYEVISKLLPSSIDGVPPRVIHSCRDINTRKESEELLRRTKETYQSILNTMSEAVYVQDANGTFIDVNDGAARMYRCRREDLIGKNPGDVAALDKNDLEYIKQVSGEVWQTGSTAKFEFWAIRRDGDVFLKEVILNKGRYFDQDVLLATARDITARRMAETKLQESEELHRALLQTVPDVIVRTDVQGNIVYVNEQIMHLFPQLSRDDILGKNMLSFIAPEDLERAKNTTSLMFEKPQGVKEYHMILKNGISVHCEVNGDLIRDAENNPIGMVYVIRDVTDRKLAQEKLRASNKMFQLVINNIPQFVFWKDRQSRFLGCNDNIARAAGLSSPEEMIGKTDYDMAWSSEETEFYLECDRRVMETGIPEYHIIEPQTRADGKLAWLDTTKVPLFDDDGKVIGILGTFEDITERIKAEQELQQEAALRQLLIEISSTFINAPLDQVSIEIENAMQTMACFFGADRCYIFDVDMTAQTYTISMEWSVEGIGAHLGDLKDIPILTDWEAFFRHCAPVYIEDVSALTDMVTKTELERLKVQSMMVFPLTHQEKCFGLVGFDHIRSIRSYTDKERQMLQVFTQLLINLRLRAFNEAELIKAKEKAEESDRLKTAFLANMSHEIRTPMNGILGFANLLREPNLNGEQQQEFIDMIEKSGMRMLNIINDIINISKIEAGSMGSTVKATNINEQLGFVYSFFKPEAAMKHIALQMLTPLPTEEAIIITDPEKLYAILTNLVKNALKFSHKGKVEVGYIQQEGDVLFHVSDEGIGIPKEKLDSIFERFVQADASDGRAYEGAGLGLAIAKAYVQMLGGRIWVQSVVGQGSCFFFTIPYNKAPGMKDNATQRSSREKPFAGRQLKVLVAEDDQISFWLIDRMLQGVASQVLRAKTGLEAVEMARNNQDLDIILMDIKLPGVDGNEATRLIREFNPGIPIIAQTAHGFAGDIEEARRAGCNDCILKPLDKGDLIAMIREYVHV